MANKPSIPKGTRDFSPDEMVRRNYIFDTIRSVFKKYGYQPIETPAMEKIETLMGKYGEEGDRLIFKIFPRGEKLRPLLAVLNTTAKFEQRGDEKEIHSDQFSSDTLDVVSMKMAKQITEEALRYDLTVPFARYVVQHQNEITFPFKRYQIQPVWRADRPQKGRYREFYQCDADVIGSNSLINEIELVQMVDEVFTALKVPVTIKINNRKILSGIAEVIGENDRMLDIAIAIDKIEKIGIDGVRKELMEKNFSEGKIIQLMDFFSMVANQLAFFGDGIKSNKSISLLNYLKHSNFSSSNIMLEGIKELEFIFEKIADLNLNTAQLEFDASLARGLNYYTGAIFEVQVDREKCKSTFTSSITGGGRYDDLTGVFGLPNVSGVGISFGADRIYDVLNELNLYPESVTAGTRLLFFNKGGKSETISLQLLKKVREKNIAAEIYPDNVKWEKQAKYVDAKKIPFTATIEEDGKITLKYKTGEKWNTENVSLEELINKIS